MKVFILFLALAASAFAQLFTPDFEDPGLAARPFSTKKPGQGPWFKRVANSILEPRYYPVISGGRSFPLSYYQSVPFYPFARNATLPRFPLENPLKGYSSYWVTYVEIQDALFYQDGLNLPDVGYSSGYPDHLFQPQGHSAFRPFGHSQRIPLATISSPRPPGTRTPAENPSLFHLLWRKAREPKAPDRSSRTP